MISGRALFAAGLVAYYAGILLTGTHNTVLQLLSLWGLVLLFWGRYRPRLQKRELLLMLAMTAMFIAAALSYAVNGLWSIPEANLSRYARFLLFVPVYLAARGFATARGFWLAVLVGAGINGIWAALEMAGVLQHPKDRWVFDVNGGVNPIQFGDISLLLAMLVCAGAPVYRSWGRHHVWLALVAAALGLLGCLGSNTRGAWIAVPLLLLINTIHLLRADVSRKQLALATVTVLAVGMLVLPFTRVVWQTRGALEEIQAYREGRMGAARSGMGASVSVRFEQWQASWDLFKSNPALGVGPGLYLARVSELNAATGRYNAKALQFSHPHSEYAFVMATLGALGLLALALLWLVPLWFFARALRSGGKATQPIAVAGVILVAGYLQFGLTESLMFQHATFLGFYLLTVAVLVALLEQASQNGRREKPA